MDAKDMKVEAKKQRGRPRFSEEAKLQSQARHMEWRKQYRLTHKAELLVIQKRHTEKVLETKKWQCDKCDRCFASKQSRDHHLLISKAHKT